MQRNPEDVITILETIFDIKKETAFKMITENPIKAVLKGKQRKLFKTTKRYKILTKKINLC